MSRVQMEKGAQKQFLSDAWRISGLEWGEIAKLCNVCDRTLRDWRNEKLKMTHEAALKLTKLTEIHLPEPFEILPEYWNVKAAAAKGGKARYNISGNPGTPEGRSKGGTNSQAKFKANPEYAKKIGVIIRKEIKIPSESELLAEFIGILLGDGSVSKNQIKISYNRITDKPYSLFLQRSISELFGIDSTVSSRTDSLGEDVIASGRNIIDFLVSKGMNIGDKIVNQADIPDWILNNNLFMCACVRGLVDTDGSFYLYRHKVNNTIYTNFSMCFTNYSKPLLDSAFRILGTLGFSPVRYGQRVYLHKSIDIARYFDIINTHNQKHRDNYEYYMKLKQAGEVRKRL